MKLNIAFLKLKLQISTVCTPSFRVTPYSCRLPDNRDFSLIIIVTVCLAWSKYFIRYCRSHLSPISLMSSSNFCQKRPELLSVWLSAGRLFHSFWFCFCSANPFCIAHCRSQPGNHFIVQSLWFVTGCRLRLNLGQIFLSVLALYIAAICVPLAWCFNIISDATGPLCIARKSGHCQSQMKFKITNIYWFCFCSTYPF